MEGKLEKKDYYNEKSAYVKPDCFYEWVDAFGYHFVDLCRYMPEKRK